MIRRSGDRPDSAAGSSLEGQRIGPYLVAGRIGSGGPAAARGTTERELWRGLAVAKLTRTL